MKREYNKLLFVFLTVIPALIFLGVSNLYGESAFASHDVTKIEPQVIDELEKSGNTDFFVWMIERADISAASELDTQIQKRQFVYDAVRSTAVRSQSNLRKFLDEKTVHYRPFYIANKILIYQGDLELLYKVAARPDVEKITANHSYQVLDPSLISVEIDQPAVIEPNLTFVNADDVWSMGITGQGTVVAGNDTGIDETHPALMFQYRGCVDPPLCTTWDHNYNWWDATGTYPDNPYDGHNHGTYTTGIMVGDDGAGNQIGMAPGAWMIHCKMLNDGGSTTDAMIIECLEWDLAPWDLNHQNPDLTKAPDAVNNAWGLWGGGQDQFRDEIITLQMAGTIVAFATGGEGPGCSTLRSPADYHEVLTVGGVDHTGGILPGTLMYLSARGPSTLDPSPPHYFPDVIAPGVYIRSSINNPSQGYQVWSGTSASVSHTPGLVALCWSASPGLKGEVYTTMQIIKDSAVPLTGQNGSDCGGDYDVGPNNDWGYGAIDALETVNACIIAGEAGQLNGTVSDALNLNPLENASITAISEFGLPWLSFTDPFGFYMLTIPSGTYTVTAEHYFYTPVISIGIVITANQISVLNFNLMPQGSLNGYITDYTYGLPLNATIRANGLMTETNPTDGFYELFLDEDHYEVEASSTGYITQTTSVSIIGGTELQLDFELVPVSFPYIPTASFTSNSPIFLGETAIFTNTSDFGNPPEATFAWDFGDSFTSTLENPFHNYTQTSVYTITFEVCNPVGCDVTQEPFVVMDQPMADLSIDKVDLNDPVKPGESIIYMITIINHGPDDALNVTLTDSTEYDFTLVAAGASCDEGLNTIICGYLLITAGDEVTIEIILQPHSNASLLVNHVEITSDLSDPSPDDNVDTEFTMVTLDVVVHTFIPLMLR
jgi:uncharacterized repeat protein (TIGR01451 family)